MTSGKHRAWLVLVSSHAGLEWVLGKGRLAFPATQTKKALSMSGGDAFVLYVARGAFNNPTRDRAQVVAHGALLDQPTAFKKPIHVGEREFASGCRVTFRAKLLPRQGVPFVPLVPRMSFIRRKDVWSVYVRTSLVLLPASDLRILVKAIDAQVTQQAGGQ